MRLAHLHLPAPIAYAHSLRLQEALLSQHFSYNESLLHKTQSLKKRGDGDTKKSVAGRPAPRPTLLTFQTQPTYTVGRRHLKTNALSQSQIDFLTRTSAPVQDHRDNEKTATFYASPRGGLLTYHAPGQLTAYLVLNLRYHGITPRCFVRLWESTVIRTCARHGVPNTLTTQDPGVWIGQYTDTDTNTPTSTESSVHCGLPPEADNNVLRATDRKICAIGVHVTRGITSHGIGFNVLDAAIPHDLMHLYPTNASSNGGTSTQPKEAKTARRGYLSWGFNRIVACGLEGKSVTWLRREGAFPPTTIDSVAITLAEEICRSLTSMGKIEMDGVDQVREWDVLSMEVQDEHEKQ